MPSSGLKNDVVAFSRVGLCCQRSYVPGGQHPNITNDCIARTSVITLIGLSCSSGSATAAR